MSRISNSEARQYVMRHEEFVTHNQTMFAKHHEWHTNLTGKTPQDWEIVRTYVVYSYGSHFPMYIYDFVAGMWLGNSDKYSRTTTRHQTLTRPNNVMHWLTTDQMRRAQHHGFVGVIRDKFKEAA